MQAAEREQASLASKIKYIKNRLRGNVRANNASYGLAGCLTARQKAARQRIFMKEHKE